jgi:fibronectin-binding autotransporter adhesin
MNRFAQWMLFMMIACLFSAAPLQAAVFYWNNPAEDDINTLSNWTSDTPPTVNLPTTGDWMWVGTTNALGQLTATADITSDYLNNAAPAAYLYVGRGAGTNGTINQTSGTLVLAGGVRGIGRDGGTGTYNMSGGELTMQATTGAVPFLMGSGAGSVGTLVMTNSATINIGGDNSIGFPDQNTSAHIGDGGGTAHLAMTDSAVINSAGNFYLARDTGSNADMNMSSFSTYNNTGGWTVIGGGYQTAGGGTGTLNVLDGATWNSQFTIFGYRGGGATVIFNTFTPSTINGGWQVANSENVGPTVADVTLSGFTSISNPGGGWVLVGEGLGGNGTLTVNDSATISNLNDIVMIGHNNGTGTLNLNTPVASLVPTVAAGGLQIGNSEDSGITTTGIVNMTGASSVSVNYLFVGAWIGGNGTLNMTDDSSIVSTGTWEATRIGDLGATGVVNMSGHASLTSGNSITVGDSENHGTTASGEIHMTGNSVINISAGAGLGGNFHLGLWSGSHGVVTMTDDATINMDGWTLLVGDNWWDNGTGHATTLGRGEFTMLKNSKYINTTGDISVGNNALSEGVFTMGSATTTDNPFVQLPGWFYLGSGGGGIGTVNVYSGTIDH